MGIVKEAPRAFHRDVNVVYSMDLQDATSTGTNATPAVKQLQKGEGVDLYRGEGRLERATVSGRDGSTMRRSGEHGEAQSELLE